MKYRNWFILGIFALLAAVFMFFQNFSFPERAPASAGDFNDMIQESQQSQKDLANKLHEAHPPEQLEMTGLSGKKGDIKKEVIEDTGESVVAHDSNSFFPDPAKKLEKEDKSDLKRLSNELKDSE